MRKPRLRSLLLGSFLLTAVIPVSLLGWWINTTVDERIYESVQDKHLLVARNLTSALSVYARDLALTLQHAANQASIDDNTRILLRNQNIHSIHHFNQTGKRVESISTQDGVPPKPLSPAQRELLSAMPESGFSPVHLGKADKPTILIRTRLPEQGGSLVGELSTDYFRTLQSAISFGKLGHAAIVDQAGNVIAHPKAAWVSSVKNIAKVSAVARMMAGESGVETFYSPALKANMIAGFSTVAGPGWGAMIPQPLGELQESASAVRNGVLATASGGVLLAALISWYLSGLLTRPTRHLAEQALLVAKDDRHPLVPESAVIREQDALATAFTTMVAAIAEKNATLLFNAQHDPLTGLANRPLFSKHIDALVGEGASFTIALLDLNDFKEINDHWGHSHGDEVLKTVARRIEYVISERCVPARLGGDEFGILFSPQLDQSMVESLAHQLKLTLSGEYKELNDNLGSGCSIGLARYPEDARSARDLLQSADLAMYAHKSQREQSFQWYEQKMRDDLDEHVALKAELRQALEQGDLRLHYQPKVDANTFQIVGLEALLRWEHPERGDISPGLFIPLIEQSALINDVANWVLHTICKQLNSWKSQNLPLLPVAVNLSHGQFDDPLLVDRMFHILHTHQIPSEAIEVEITESILAKHPERVTSSISRLKQRGCLVTIDDLGTGQSSLARVKDLDIDRIKIDKSFLSDLADNPRSASLLNQIVGIGLALDLRVVVEGVETPEQLTIVRETGCHELQGFLFSKAVDADTVSELLRSEIDTASSALRSLGKDTHPSRRA